MININSEWKYEPSPPPKTTGYTTTWNCRNGKYPIRQSILSWSWLDKIVVLDGGSTDGTMEVLRELEKELDGKLSIIEMPIPLDMPGKDGYQKTMAYSMVDTPLAIQFDIDEICLGSHEKWKELLKDLPDNVDILNLPIIEPYNSLNCLRVNKEHTPWKWRIFRVKPEIMHGIPKGDQLEIDGVKYSRGGSDGCFPVHVVTEEMISSKMNDDCKKIINLKNKITKFDDFNENMLAYESYFQHMIGNETPCVLHVGHLNLKNKINHYLSSWHWWWCHLYNKDVSDPKNNLYFPGFALSDITDEMIKDRVLNDRTPIVALSGLSMLYDESK